jgi:hypothetical protein
MMNEQNNENDKQNEILKMNEQNNENDGNPKFFSFSVLLSRNKPDIRSNQKN